MRPVSLRVPQQITNGANVLLQTIIAALDDLI